MSLKVIGNAILS